MCRGSYLGKIRKKLQIRGLRFTTLKHAIYINNANNKNTCADFCYNTGYPSSINVLCVCCATNGAAINRTHLILIAFDNANEY